MSDIYLWYQHLPDVDPARYDSPEEYLEAVRYRPLDSSFSYIADRAATEALFSSSQYAGFGFSSAFGPPTTCASRRCFPAARPPRRASRAATRSSRSTAGRSPTCCGPGQFGTAYGAAGGRRARRAGGGARGAPSGACRW